jgi:hypothetical protein
MDRFKKKTLDLSAGGATDATMAATRQPAATMQATAAQTLAGELYSFFVAPGCCELRASRLTFTTCTVTCLQQ